MAEAVSYQVFDSTKTAEHEKNLLRNQVYTMRHPDNPSRAPLWPPHIQPRMKETDLKGIATQRVYEWESDSTWFRSYEVEVHDFTAIHYVLDLTGTTNHEIQGTFGVQDQKVIADLQPFELETVALLSRNLNDAFKFSVRMQWVTSDPHPSIIETALGLNKQNIEREWNAQAQGGVDPRSQDKSEVQGLLQTSGLVFVDPHFYPCERSLYLEAESSPLVMEESVMWRRVTDYCANPQVFEDGISPGDVRQGRLGNCWFCCSLASLAEREDLINRLFVSTEHNPQGLYHVRMCHNGVWRDIILDDYIPCKPYSGPLYTKTLEDELWVALLEKAYAKLYGCYERLVAGSPYTSLPDLTGNPAEIFELQRLKPDDLQALWTDLLEWNRTENEMMTASCGHNSRRNPEDAGLLVDHSYTIVDGKEGLGHRLLCIRNPWGHGEWQGAWSDDSELWDAETKAFFNPTFDPEDGLFWMAFEDFLEYFESIIVCYCRRDWKEGRMQIQLRNEHNGETPASETIRVVVGQNSVLNWISLYQTDEREQGAPEYTDLAVFVFREEGDARVPIGFFGMGTTRQLFGKFPSIGSGSANLNLHCGHNVEVLTEGSYLVVPFTSGVLWSPDLGNQRLIGVAAHAHPIDTQLPVGDLHIESAGEFGPEQISNVLSDFCRAFGDAKPWHDLTRYHLKVGQMDIYGAYNSEESGKIMTLSMSGDLDNVTNAYGFPDVGPGVELDIIPAEMKLCAVQVMINPKEAGATAYKFGLKSRAYVP